jgi:hypothetical protein
MLRKVPLLLTVTAVLTLSSCEPLRPSQQAAQKVEITPTAHDLSADEIKQYLSGGTETIEPSTSQALSGDVRPFWFVAGKVKNTYSQDIKTAKIRVIAYDNKTHEVLDTADFEVGDIPANSTRAYRRQVQSMVKWNAFYFYDSILSAKTAP